MDKCKYGQLYPFCFCIPHSTDVSILYTVQHRRLPWFTVSLYIWHYVKFGINMLYRNLFFSFWTFCTVSPHGVERNTCTQPDLQVAQFKTLSCCFFTKWKCFYSRNVLPLIIKAHCCIDIVTGRLFSTVSLKLSKLKCSCSPYAFSIYERLLHCHCRQVFIFRAFTSALFNVLQNASPI